MLLPGKYNTDIKQAPYKIELLNRQFQFFEGTKKKNQNQRTIDSSYFHTKNNSLPENRQRTEGYLSWILRTTQPGYIRLIYLITSPKISLLPNTRRRLLCFKSQYLADHWHESQFWQVKDMIHTNQFFF